MPANLLFSYSVVKERLSHELAPQPNSCRVWLKDASCGGEYRIRTGDLRLARAALSQLS
jgi:hypothetical protein